MSDGGNEDSGSGSDPDGGRGPTPGNGSHGRVPGTGPDATVLAVFEDPAPRTAREVAETLDEDVETVTAHLDAMVAAGRLGRKSVGRGDRSVTVWYPTPGGNGNGAAKAATGDGDGAADDPPSLETDWDVDEISVRGDPGSLTDEDGGVDDRIADHVERLEVPGVSEMMREWRRAAIRAAFEYLVEAGRARSADVVDATYPGHRAGYSDREEWWDCVAPRLGELPGVERDGDVWEWAGAE